MSAEVFHPSLQHESTSHEGLEDEFKLLSSNDDLIELLGSVYRGQQRFDNLCLEHGKMKHISKKEADFVIHKLINIDLCQIFQKSNTTLIKSKVDLKKYAEEQGIYNFDELQKEHNNKIVGQLMKNVRKHNKKIKYYHKLLRQALEETLLNSEQLEHILGKIWVSGYNNWEQDYIRVFLGIGDTGAKYGTPLPNPKRILRMLWKFIEDGTLVFPQVSPQDIRRTVTIKKHLFEPEPKEDFYAYLRNYEKVQTAHLYRYIKWHEKDIELQSKMKLLTVKMKDFALNKNFRPFIETYINEHADEPAHIINLLNEHYSTDYKDKFWCEKNLDTYRKNKKTIVYWIMIARDAKLTFFDKDKKNIQQRRVDYLNSLIGDEHNMITVGQKLRISYISQVWRRDKLIPPTVKIKTLNNLFPIYKAVFKKKFEYGCMIIDFDFSQLERIKPTPMPLTHYSWIFETECEHEEGIQNKNQESIITTFNGKIATFNGVGYIRRVSENGEPYTSYWSPTY